MSLVALVQSCGDARIASVELAGKYACPQCMGTHAQAGDAAAQRTLGCRGRAAGLLVAIAERAIEHAGDALRGAGQPISVDLLPVPRRLRVRHAHAAKGEADRFHAALLRWLRVCRRFRVV
jgi:predicted RNA-binding Zn-ribbon protein involved in translation (DUF1610 family)